MTEAPPDKLTQNYAPGPIVGPTEERLVRTLPRGQGGGQAHDYRVTFCLSRPAFFFVLLCLLPRPRGSLSTGLLDGRGTEMGSVSKIARGKEGFNASASSLLVSSSVVFCPRGGSKLRETTK